MKKLTEEHGRQLLDLAHAVIRNTLTEEEVDIPQLQDPSLQEKGGTFVTLKINNQLRGCIGNIEPVKSVVDGIRDNASNAAFHDSRFPPLSRDELDRVEVSISILSRAEKLTHSGGHDLIKKLTPARDGVILRKGRAGATFLPQVWQQLPDVELFLSQLCLKAGLRKDCWRDDDTEILVYQVQSFGEDGR